VPRTVCGTETVLLVEDEPALRALTKQVLSSHGYVVLEAANGMQALQLLDHGDRRIDLLITDVIMPGMSGLELANRISQRCPGARIAFMSGYSDLPDQLASKGYVIQKPMSPHALLLQLRSILGARAGRHGAA
jgi:CheY-like chemotaxis protein